MYLFTSITSLCKFCKHLKNCRYYSLGIKSEVTATFSNGTSLVLETGQQAKLANGAVIGTMGATSVLSTAVRKPSKFREHAPSFVPLLTNYHQKHCAAGKIPRSYLRREFGFNEQEILTSRLIDRCLRPLFPGGFTDETEVTSNLMAVDGVYTPDIISINAASAALSISSIPFNGPVGAVRIGCCGDKLIINPTRSQLQDSDIDLVVASAPKELVVSLEGAFSNVKIEKLQAAIKLGITEGQVVVQAIHRLCEMAGKTKQEVIKQEISKEIMETVSELCKKDIIDVFTNYEFNKKSRDTALHDSLKNLILRVGSEFEGRERALEIAFKQLSKDLFRKLIFDTGVRCDGRISSDVRSIHCVRDIYGPLHGSSLIQRGQTQVQATVAYDSLEYANSINSLLQATGGDKDRNFVLHYTFPAYSNDELQGGVARGLSRREVGHGALAERALRPLIPRDLPYAVLLAATVQESNGSSSMSTVCGGSIALYDAGVQLLAPAAGIAMGLVTDVGKDGTISKHRVLTDILGIEDFLGDLDLKVAGTRTGVTALQADVKIPIPFEIISEALEKTTTPLNLLLDAMAKTIDGPRKEKKCWPVIKTVEVPSSRRQKLVGPGGTTIKKLQAQTGVEIKWEEGSRITIFAPTAAAYEEVKKLLDPIIREPTLHYGEIYSARVVKLCTSGVMVQIDEMTPVFLDKSQFNMSRAHHKRDYGIQVGDIIQVKFVGVDPTSGHMRLLRQN